MSDIRRILAVSGDSALAARAVMRAAMLSIELRAETLELLTLQDTRLGLSTPATSALSTQVHMPALAAFMALGRYDTALPSHTGDVVHRRSLRPGQRACAIAERARELGADLTVIAARERTRMADLLFRNGIDETILLVERPLLVVRSRPASSYARVLVATDFSGHAMAAARVAMLIAPAAHLTFLHACRTAQHGSASRAIGAVGSIDARQIRACEQARAELGRFIAALGPSKQLIARSVCYGHAVPVICAHAGRLRPDLIVVGKRGMADRAGDDTLPGGVTASLVGRAGCDLLIVPAPERGRWHDRPAA